MSNTEIENLQTAIAINRDQAAYKKLFYLLYELLFNFVFSILRDLHAAEDVVSEVLLKVWTMGASLSGVNNLKAYLFRAARNTAINQLHKKSPYDIYAEDLETEDPDNPELQLISKQSLQHINEAIDQLPPKCRMVFTLVKLQNLSYQETADALDISVNTVNRHMQIALTKLYDMFKDGRD